MFVEIRTDIGYGALEVICETFNIHSNPIIGITFISHFLEGLCIFSPAFEMARCTFSLGMFTPLALAMASLRRGLADGSDPPPSRTAIAILFNYPGKYL
jgi:hypothetical protein